MIYNIAEFTKDKEIQIEIKDEISLEKYESLKNIFNDINLYTHAKQLLDMSIKNGNILYNYLDQTIKKYSDPTLKLENINNVGNNANKYIYDFSTSVITFIEYLERSLNSKDKYRKEDFHKKVISRIYDNSFEYRFWYYMRNYIVHYDLPFNKIERDFSGLKIISESEHLLKYKEWKGIKEYIQNKKQIPIIELIKPMQSILFAIYTEYLFYIRFELEEMKNNFEKFMKEYDLENPTIVSYESIEELKKGIMSMYPFGLNVLTEAFLELNRHPNVNVIFTEK